MALAQNEFVEMNGFFLSRSSFTYWMPHVFLYTFSCGRTTNDFRELNSSAETERLFVAKYREQFGSVIDYKKDFTNMLMSYTVGTEMHFSEDEKNILFNYLQKSIWTSI